MTDILLQCPFCNETFVYDDEHIADINNLRPVNSARRPEGKRLQTKHKIKSLLAKAIDHRTPVNERLAACKAAESIMRKNKVKLGDGLDKEILAFQYYRGWLAGFSQANAPKLSPTGKDKS